jgi:hypothetical protein
MKRRVIAGVLAGTLTAVAAAGTVSAGAVSHYDFYNCTGPGPSSFEAVKTLLPGSAAHPVSAAGACRVVGSTDVFAVFDFGFGAVHGIDVSGVATTSCWIDLTVGTVQFSGIYVPGS